LVLYAPPASADKKNNNAKSTSLPIFRKNLYTQEIIDFIIELVNQGEKTKQQIMDDYKIPKTTRSANTIEMDTKSKYSYLLNKSKNDIIDEMGEEFNFYQQNVWSYILKISWFGRKKYCFCFLKEKKYTKSKLNTFMESLQPDYRRIYTDIISRKYPHKEEKCKTLLNKKDLSFLDIIKLNSLIFETKTKETKIFNQRHRSYDKFTILEILGYQKKNKFNNTQLANHFKLSRNSIAKWKLFFTNQE
jgi:hypothetical protein